MEQKRETVPPEAEAAIRAAGELPAAEAAATLAAIANRAAAALHKVAREAAEARRGTAEWSRWARLQNASRDAVLRTAASRESARSLLDETSGLA